MNHTASTTWLAATHLDMLPAFQTEKTGSSHPSLRGTLTEDHERMGSEKKRTDSGLNYSLISLPRAMGWTCLSELGQKLETKNVQGLAQCLALFQTIGGLHQCLPVIVALLFIILMHSLPTTSPFILQKNPMKYHLWH